MSLRNHRRPGSAGNTSVLASWMFFASLALLIWLAETLSTGAFIALLLGLLNTSLGVAVTACRRAAKQADAAAFRSVSGPASGQSGC